MALFGPDGVSGTGMNLRPLTYLVPYIGRIIANIWHQQSVSINRDMARIKTLEQSVEKKWQRKLRVTICIAS